MSSSQITFGAIAKGKLLPKVIPCRLSSFWTAVLVLNKKSFKYELCNGCNSLPVQNWTPPANLLTEYTECMQHWSCFPIPLGELKLTQKMRPRLEISTHLGSFYSLRSIQLNHFQADLIWCDGTFQEIPITTAASKNVNVSIGGENFNKMHKHTVL